MARRWMVNRREPGEFGDHWRSSEKNLRWSAAITDLEADGNSTSQKLEMSVVQDAKGKWYVVPYMDYCKDRNPDYVDTIIPVDNLRKGLRLMFVMNRLARADGGER